MPLYIRDDSVDRLAEQLRKALGAKSKTDAVRTALSNELDRLTKVETLREKLATVRSKARARLGPPVTGIDMKKVMDDLWDKGGE